VNSATPTTLAETLQQFEIALPDDQIEMLDRYRRELWDWNEKLNLTRHTTLEKFVTRDIVDSMSLEKFIEPGDRVLDVGTGGGVPGVILAILRPDIQVTLCESMAKKAKVVADIISPLGMEIGVFHARAETLLDEYEFETLVARAVAPLIKIAKWFGPYWGTFNQLLMVKGPNWPEERLEAREAGLLRDVDLRRMLTYPTPGSEIESVILKLSSRHRKDE